MIYFGCYGEPGHGFYRSMPTRSMRRSELLPMPWSASECDGNLQPGTAELKSRHNWKRPDSQPEGVCRIHYRIGWTAMAFWDRSGDHRKGSCSVLIENRELSFGEMVKLFEESFPDIHARCTAKFELVEEKS